MGVRALPASLPVCSSLLTMKILAFLSLIAVATARSDQDMVEYWKNMKAFESCWGEGNMKLYTVNMKKAIAKCGQVDAPELSLPPFRSTYRFVSSILGNANSMENRQANMVWRLLESMKSSFSDSPRPYRDYSYNRDSMDNEVMMNVFMKMMNKMMHEDVYNSNIPKSFDNVRTSSYRQNDPMARMSQFVDMFSRSRSKRAAGDDVGVYPSDLGDRLVEKLNEKKRVMEEEIGNMTCVMKEMGYLNHQNDLYLHGMKEDLKQYTMPSPWFENRYKEMQRTCYEMATNLPAQIEEQSVVTGETFGSVKMAEVRASSSASVRLRRNCAWSTTSRRRSSPTLGPWRDPGAEPADGVPALPLGRTTSSRRGDGVY